MKALMNKCKIDQKLLKFLLVGVANTLFGTAIMFSMYNFLHCNYYLSSFCNYFFGSILSYFLNKYFTFEYKKQNKEVIICFIINILLCYLFSYTIAQPLVTLLLKNQTNQQLKDNIAMLVGTGFFTVCNYFGQRLFVFKTEENNK